MGARARSSTSPPDLQTRLGYTFRDRALLQRALTHASVGGESNERLEFLGDRVLGLVIAQRLFEMYPGDSEGKLALKFNALVRREACASAAEAAGLPEYLILAGSEEVSGGRRKLVILAGACEAIIAALYLDGGMEAARSFIDRYWRDAMAALNEDMRDAKTRLQEWTQAQDGQYVPVYSLVRREGPDHAPRFVTAVRVGDMESETGEGNSKRDSEQAAARAMLARLGLL
jgi:ribonuclease III